MVPQYFLLSAAILSAVCAQDDGTVYRDFEGASGSPYGSLSNGRGSAEAVQRFEQANQNPNVTKSFQFAPFFVGGVNNGGVITPDESNEWTLRLNVTDFAVADAVREFPGDQPPLVNPHVTNTVFELEWPQGGSLKSALNGSTAPFCFSLTLAPFRPNITNLVTEESNDGDCGPVLGEDCISAMKLQAAGNDCQIASLQDEPACIARLGTSRWWAEDGGLATAGNVNMNRTTGNATGYDAVVKGTDGRYGMYSSSTEAYNATNTTLYEEAANQLYVMLLSIAPADNAGGPWAQTALCMRANASRLAAEDDAGSDGGGGEGDEGGDSGSDEDSGSDDGGGGGESGSSALMPTALSLAALGWIVYGLL